MPENRFTGNGLEDLEFENDPPEISRSPEEMIGAAILRLARPADPPTVNVNVDADAIGAAVGRAVARELGGLKPPTVVVRAPAPVVIPAPTVNVAAPTVNVAAPNMTGLEEAVRIAAEGARAALVLAEALKPKPKTITIKAPDGRTVEGRIA